MKQAKTLLMETTGTSKRGQDKFKLIFGKATWKTRKLTWQTLKLGYNASVYNDVGFLAQSGSPMTGEFSHALSHFTEMYGSVKGMTEVPYRHMLTTEALHG